MPHKCPRVFGYTRKCSRVNIHVKVYTVCPHLGVYLHSTKSALCGLRGVLAACVGGVLTIPGLLSALVGFLRNREPLVIPVQLFAVRAIEALMEQQQQQHGSSGNAVILLLQQDLQLARRFEERILYDAACLVQRMHCLDACCPNKSKEERRRKKETCSPTMSKEGRAGEERRGGVSRREKEKAEEDVDVLLHGRSGDEGDRRVSGSPKTLLCSSSSLLADEDLVEMCHYPAQVRRMSSLSLGVGVLLGGLFRASFSVGSTPALFSSLAC